MNLNERKALLVQLGAYMLSKDEVWRSIKQKAYGDNNWFTEEFVNEAVQTIAENYLTEAALQKIIETYAIPDAQDTPKVVGIVMAGNIPLVGFHDFLCVFISGHIAAVKPSSKDEVLIKHLIEKIIAWNEDAKPFVQIREMLKNCDAYIATGSNNSSRYFEYYFQKYPHIIRKNRTSVAILNGNETNEQLNALADDVYRYFGLGCRNVTKLYVPEHYDFVPLLDAFKKYQHLMNHHKYKNNYDYNLAILLLNNRYYMTNGSLLLTEALSPFSPISQLHYETYKNKESVLQKLSADEAVQCIVSNEATPFGTAQQPQITDYADGIDTLEFLLNLS